MRTKTLLISVLALCLSVSMAFAVTPYKTEIKNKALGNYADTNNNEYQTESNEVSTTVSRIAGLDFGITPQSADILGGETVIFKLTVTNTGNWKDTLSLATIFDESGGAINTAEVYLDKDGSGTKTGGDELVVAPFPLEMGATSDLIVIVTNVSGEDGETNITKVTVTSEFDTAVKETASLTTTVKRPVFAFTMSAAPTNPEPGDPVIFTIKVENTGTGIAKNVDVNSVIATDYMENVTDLKINGDDPASGQTASYDNGIVNFSLGTLNGASDEVILTFKANVMGNVGVGVKIPYNSTLDHENDVETPQDQLVVFDPDAELTVAEISGVVVSPSDSTTVVPGTVVQHIVTVKNEGNAEHTFVISYSESDGIAWDWEIYLDKDNDGNVGEDDEMITDSENNGEIDIDAYDEVQLIAIATVPVGTADEVVNELKLIATKDDDPSITDFATFTVTVEAPVLSLAKTVSPTGPQPPKTVLTYTLTVTNTGSGKAQTITITDPIPTNTTYQENTMKMRTKTGPGEDDWGVWSSAGTLSGDDIIFSLTEMAAGAVVQFSFQVKIN